MPGIDREVFASLSVVGWAGTMVVATAARELWQRRSARLAQTRNEERLELARELHDTVAHHVTAIVVAAQAGVVVASSRPEEAGRALEAIERAGAEALDGMRRMVGVLRSGSGDDTGDGAVRTPGTASTTSRTSSPASTPTVAEPGWRSHPRCGRPGSVRPSRRPRSGWCARH